MNTTIFSPLSVPLFKTSWSLDLPPQKNKILIIAFCALGLLTALYLARKHNQRPLMSKDHLTKLNEQNIMEDSLKRVKELGDLQRTTEDRVYVAPCVSMIDLNQFLEPYTVGRNYKGVSFSMRTNRIYDKTFPNELFTAVYFKKADFSFYYHLKNYFTFSRQPVNLEAQKKELEDFVLPMIDKWGYSSIQVGKINEEFFSEKQTKSDYELYLLLFYRKSEISAGDH